MNARTYTLRQRPDLRAQVARLGQEAWPEFLLHGDTDHWGHLFTDFADFQLLICDADDRVVALGQTVPLTWDGTVTDLPATIDAIIVRGLEGLVAGRAPNALAAVAAIVGKADQGRGLSTAALQAMRQAAAAAGCRAVIVPLRPTWKSRYPLIPMEAYCAWTRPDGAPFDPWIRVHWRLGAQQLAIAPKTLTVTGTVAQWEAWTGIPMPGSGQYVVPGALQPVVVDRERDVGLYEDPNLWVVHSIPGSVESGPAD